MWYFRRLSHVVNGVETTRIFASSLCLDEFSQVMEVWVTRETFPAGQFFPLGMPSEVCGGKEKLMHQRIQKIHTRIEVEYEVRHR